MQSFEELISIVKKLRGENGCAWDKVQTFDSLIPCFLEESYEVVDGISKRDYKNIKEELGDVLLHIVFFSELANDENKFNIDEVIKNINEKLIRRHPHVFGESNIKDVDGILKQWDEIKKEEKAEKENKNYKSVLDDIPNSLPVMERAYKLMKRAASVGFEYKNADDSLKKVEEEFLEVKEAYNESKENNNKEHLEEEIGDLIMTILDFARMNKINPVNSLIKTNNKFIRRFNYVEEKANEQNKNLADMTLEEMDLLWNECKINEYKLKGEIITMKKVSPNKKYTLFDLLKIIIDKRYETKITSQEHINALLEAINRSSKADIIYKNENKLTCLHLAVQIGSADIVKALIEKGADVNAITDRGVTPLHLAIVKKQPEEIIKVLIENGADYNVKEANFSAMELAKLMDVDYMHLFYKDKE